MKYALLSLVLALASPLLQANDPDLTSLIEALTQDATMIITNLAGDVTYTYNRERAEALFATASTFKIPNTLIGLEENVVSKADTVIEWDGKQYDNSAWNRDQTLASAYQLSCVWCYQKIAARVGPEKYRSHLSALGYGELAEEFNTTTFWLDGSLKISATDQIKFLKRVHLEDLPFRTEVIRTLKDIMIEEENESFTLRSKTGWATRVYPQVGWYVGYVETSDDVWFFATNLVTRDNSDLRLRKQLTLQALKFKGVID